MKINRKFFLAFIFTLTVFSSCLFSQDNMRISLKEGGEVITGYKTRALPQEIKITVAYPDNYMQKDFSRAPVIFIFDTEGYSIADLKQMFNKEKDKNKNTASEYLIVLIRFRNENISQKEFDNFIAELFPFFEINYSSENDPSKRFIIARNSIALLALNSIHEEANYFYNLGIILDKTTSLPFFDTPFKKQSRIFCLSQYTNILNLQDLFTTGSLEPMQNFFLKIQENSYFQDFDLRYFSQETARIKKIKPVLSKEISEDVPFYLQVKTVYGNLDFFPTQIQFAPPVLWFNDYSGNLEILLPEPLKIKISGIFAGKKWSVKTRIVK